MEAQIFTTSTQNSISESIPDNDDEGITREFDLTSSNIRVEHVTLRVDISHLNRGDLAITLTSPNGTESKLSEVHSDPNNNYDSFTFSSVRTWGENSRGTWTVNVADRSGGNSTVGTLNSLQLTVFGASAAPTNPAPQLVITNPADNALFSPGASVTVNVTASDFDIDENVSPITNVQLFVNGVAAGIDPIASLLLQHQSAAWQCDNYRQINRSRRQDRRVSASEHIRRESGACGGKFHRRLRRAGICR